MKPCPKRQSNGVSHASQMTDRRLPLFPLLLLAAGYAFPPANHAETATAPVQILDSAVQCTPSNKEPQVILIHNQQQLQQIASRLRGSIVPSSTFPLPVVDFNRWRVLYISAGEQPTAGYSLTLDTPPFTGEKRNGTLHLHLNTPPADAMAAAIITHPCILVQIPVREYSTIEIRGLDRKLKVTLHKRLPTRKAP